MSETEVVRSTWAHDHEDLKAYYDSEWGMPVFDENGVFERLSLEAFQSGLSWLTILRKRENFRAAFAGFDIATVAAFGADDIERLLADAGIIRNRAKILATINNANAILKLHERGFQVADLVWAFMPERSPLPQHDGEVPATSTESIALAKALKKQGFAFVGPTTAYALMTAIGIADVHLEASHRRACSGLWRPNGERTAEGERVSVAARAGVAGLLGHSHQ